MAVINDVSSQQYYHGTKAELELGDLIGPGYDSNYGKRKRAAGSILPRRSMRPPGGRVAVGEGRGRIYIVEPTGPIEDDPNLTDRKYPGNATKSYRSRDPLRVRGELTDRKGHSDEELKVMRDFLEELKQRRVEAIGE